MIQILHAFAFIQCKTDTITEQAPEEIAIDAWHDLVYAQTTGAAYGALFSRDEAGDEAWLNSKQAR